MPDNKTTDTDIAKSTWDRITVVIVCHNSASVLPVTLAALPDAKRIIILDAVSHDNTSDVAKATHPSVEVIRNTEDFGLAAASNQAFAQVITEYTLHINPDTKLDPGCVERLIMTADENQNAAGVAPMLTNGKGDLEIDVMNGQEINHHKISHAPDGPFSTWFITGAVVLWRNSAFQSIKGFDEGIFMYNEDADICVRSTRAGYSLILDPRATAYHFGGVSEGVSLKSRIRKDWMMAWGHLYFERKYLGEAEAKAMTQKYLRDHAKESLVGFLLFRPKKFLGNYVKAKAAYQFLCGKPLWGRFPQ